MEQGEPFSERAAKDGAGLLHLDRNADRDGGKAEGEERGGADNMKNWKHQLPILLLAVFEILAGVLLFLKPEEFTGAIIIGFGIVLLLFAVLYLIQFY